MKKSKVGYLIIASLLVWVLAQFFFLPAICSATELPSQITISREQFSELQMIINKQEKLLTELVNMSAVQQTNSDELMKLIEEQHLSYQKIKTELILAQKSLTASKETIAEQNRSLQTLSEQVKKQNDVAKRKERQKAFWGGVVGLFVGATLK